MTADITVHQAWTNVMVEVLAIRKAEQNKFQGFNFRGIDAVMNAVGPALRTHGVSVVPVEGAAVHRDFASKDGKTQHEAIVTVTYRVTGPAGDHFDGWSIGEAADSSDKATTQSMSVAFRTFLLQALCIPTDAPDPDLNTVERPPPVVFIDGPDVARLKAILGSAPDREETDAAWTARFGVPVRALPLARLAEADDFVSDLTPSDMPITEATA